MFNILRSLAMIALVVSAVAGGTYAVFNKTTRVADNTITVGRIGSPEVYNLPYNFSNISPGNYYKSDVMQVKHEGTEPADLYFGIKWQSGLVDMKPVLEAAIEEMIWNEREWVHSRWVTGWTPIENYFGNWTKFASSMNPGWSNGYRINLHFKKEVNGIDYNSFQGAIEKNEVILYSTQVGASPPVTEPYKY